MEARIEFREVNVDLEAIIRARRSRSIHGKGCTHIGPRHVVLEFGDGLAIHAELEPRCLLAWLDQGPACHISLPLDLCVVCWFIDVSPCWIARCVRTASE